MDAHLQPTAPFTSLPPELQLHIISFLPSSSILALSRSSRHFRRLSLPEAVRIAVLEASSCCTRGAASFTLNKKTYGKILFQLLDDPNPDETLLSLVVQHPSGFLVTAIHDTVFRYSLSVLKKLIEPPRNWPAFHHFLVAITDIDVLRTNVYLLDEFAGHMGEDTTGLVEFARSPFQDRPEEVLALLRHPSCRLDVCHLFSYARRFQDPRVLRAALQRQPDYKRTECDLPHSTLVFDEERCAPWGIACFGNGWERVEIGMHIVLCGGEGMLEKLDMVEWHGVVLKYLEKDRWARHLRLGQIEVLRNALENGRAPVESEVYKEWLARKTT